MTEPRFVLIEDNDEFPTDERTCWWWDTERSLEGSSLYQPYVAVQRRVGEDPNDYVEHTELHLLFTDQAEFYVVCGECYETNKGKQWSGSTQNPNWTEDSRLKLHAHQQKRWCEFCDPIFGSGGWE